VPPAGPAPGTVAVPAPWPAAVPGAVPPACPAAVPAPGTASTRSPDHSSSAPHDEQKPSPDGAALPHSLQTIMTPPISYEPGSRPAPLDVLVNNAGVVRSGHLGALTRDAVDTQVATNLVAPILLAQAAVAVMGAGGVVVNVTTWGSGPGRATRCTRRRMPRWSRRPPGRAERWTGAA
jgi:NAD(P)-dependent dehydrogenase (short-subunit alcohol dehydrogenase family)